MRSTRGPDRQGRRRHRTRAGPRPRLRHRAGPPRRRRRRSTTSTPTSPTRPSRPIAAAGGTRRRRGRAGRHAARRRRRWSTARSSEFGRLDVLVTNAGILRDTTLWKMTDERLRRRHHHPPARHLHLRPRRGGPACASRARAAGSSASAPPPASAATSARPTTPPPRPASSAWCAPGRWSWPAREITVNAVVPVAATAMTETIPFLKPYIEALKAGEPLPPFVRQRARLRQPEDVAGLVAFLASDAAAGITGQAIGIGGDRLALWSHPSRGRRRVRRRRLVGRRDRRGLAEGVRRRRSRPSASSSRSRPK